MTAPYPTTSPATIASYLKVRAASTPAWLADGRLAYLSDTTGVAQIWLGELASTDALPLTSFGERIGALLATPTGDNLVFGMDTGGDERYQLWTIAPNRAPRALTAEPTTIHQLGACSPDGRHVAYASNQRDQRFFDVWTVDLADPNSTPHLVLATDELLTPLAWSPDGRCLLVQRANTNLDHDLFLVPLSGEQPTLLTPHTGEASILHAKFAPGGDGIYLVSNQDRDFAALFRLDPATGRQTVLVAPEWDVDALAVAPTTGLLALTINEDGHSRLVLCDPTTGETREIRHLPTGVIDGLTWSPTGEWLAFRLSGPCHPSDIWIGNVTGEARRVTDSDLAGLDRDTFITPASVRYPAFDRRLIPALWYQPTSGAGPWPVVVDIHGGPESQRRADFNPVTQFLLTQGFAVLHPNVRGSTGYGKIYCHLDDVDRRMDAVADLASAVAWLRERSDVVADQIVALGRSYGGFMVLAALTTYPDLWAAGVDIVGIANFVTFLERTGPWRRRVRALEYGDPERDAELLRAISPIHHADRITAPLLVLHGRNDPRVPVAEAEQIVAHLGALGREVELLVFEDEGHEMTKLANRVEGYATIVRFLNRTLPGGAD